MNQKQLQSMILRIKSNNKIVNIFINYRKLQPSKIITLILLYLTNLVVRP